MTRPHGCSGVVINARKNYLEVAWVPTGTDRGEIKPCSVYRRLPNWWQIAPGRPERDLSAFIIKMEREEGAEEAERGPWGA